MPKKQRPSAVPAAIIPEEDIAVHTMNGGDRLGPEGLGIAAAK